MAKFESIKINFLSGISVQKIEFGDLLSKLSWDEQAEFLHATVLHERNVKYPLRREYQLTFVKHIIQQLEENGVEEIHDKFYECLTQLLNAADGDFSFKHYRIEEELYVSVKEANSIIRDGTTGLRVWEASIALSNYINQRRDYFAGKSIIELGSGCSGLVGLALLRLCDCKQIYLSDCHEAVLNTLQENLRLNLQEEEAVEKLEPSLLVKERVVVNRKTELGVLNIPWESIEEVSDELVSVCQPHVILGADIVYDSSIFDALLKCLCIIFSIFKNSTLEFILSQTIRNAETFEEFRVVLCESNFSIEEIPLNGVTPVIPHAADKSQIKLFKIWRNSS